VKAWKTKYGIDGVYSDGLPGVEWVSAYEEMRMLRELFPNGSIIVHDTFDQTGSVAPWSFIQTYADRTFLAEGIESDDGPNWPYPRYVVSQFRKANCIGDIKGDGWEDIGDTPAADLINIVYNGRPHAQNPWFESKVLPVLTKLHSLWLTYGEKEFFYDRYYLPEAQELTGYAVGRAGMPIIDTSANNGATLLSRTPGAEIHYTTDGSTPTPQSPRYFGPIPLNPAIELRAVAFADGLSPSRELVFSSKTEAAQ
jgi:Chitobiase/beta-hexosaminidase C-terminal domain